MSELYVIIGFMFAIIAELFGYKSDAMLALMMVIAVELKILIEAVKDR